MSQIIQWNYLKLAVTKGLTNILLLSIVSYFSSKYLSGVNIIFITLLWIFIFILIGLDVLIAKKMDIKYSNKLLKIRSFIESFSVAFIFSAIYFFSNSSNTKISFLIYNIVFACLLACILFFLSFSLNKKISININRKKIN